jgi:hypothetical protein
MQYKIIEKHKRKELALKKHNNSSLLKGFKRFRIGDSCELLFELVVCNNKP